MKEKDKDEKMKENLRSQNEENKIMKLSSIKSSKWRKYNYETEYYKIKDEKKTKKKQGNIIEYFM